jgi:ABC-type transport system substrate-binding protein
LDPTNPYNFTQYGNTQATKLHNELSTTIDLAQRKTKSQQLQKLLLDEVAYIPVMFEGDSYVVKNTIDFSDPNPTSWKAR